MTSAIHMILQKPPKWSFLIKWLEVFENLKRLKYNPHLKGKNNCVGGFASKIQIMLFLMIIKKEKKRAYEIT